MRLLWLDKVKSCAEKLILANLVAFRETLEEPDAISQLDDEGGRKSPPGYWTNIGLLSDRLVAEANSHLLKEIVTIYKSVIPQEWLDKKEVVLVASSEIWKGKAGGYEDITPTKRGATQKLITEFGLESVTSPFPNDKHVFLVSVEHSQELVNIWRNNVNQIEGVMVILGATFGHIRLDNQLPVERYMPIISQDILKVINPNIRKNMIPERLKLKEKA